MRKLEVESKTGGRYSDELCDCYIRELFVRLAREISNENDNESLNGQTKEQMRRLHRLLHSDYAKEWKIADMAKYINMSPSYLYSAYRKLYGVSPVHDLINVRIQKAKTMLSESQMSINDIASDLGYSNTSHFIRQFTKIIGVSPLKYRQSNLLENRHVF